MNHRTRLGLISSDDQVAARDGLSRLRSNRDFEALITLLEQELVIERELYETRTADDHQRGQVVMLKKVIDLLETGDK